MIDILFCALPYSNLDHIYSAPAILKGVVIDQGYSAKTVDFGSKLFKICNNNVDLFAKVQQYFVSNKIDDPEVLDIIDQFYNDAIDYLKSNKSKYIGISILSIWTHKTTWEFVSRIKQENIPSKIIVGGRGANVRPYKVFNNLFQLSSLEQTMVYGRVLEKRKLVDHVVLGDGEDAILDILGGQNSNIYNNVHSDLFKSPVPDYADYEFDWYCFGDNEICWPITGSKGCVRDCDFCDVAKQFGRYRYRSGADIANEMIAIAASNNARKFMFSDSLVNGGLKPFKEFLEIIADYNKHHPDQKLRWSGQYVCRPDVPEEIYELIKLSGGEGLTIGAESGSNAVLNAMNKKTTVEALLTELEQFRKYNISCLLLLMVGHWSEKWEDFLDHCQMIINIAPYVRSGNVSAIHVGFPMIIHDQTPAWDNHEKNEIILSDFDPSNIWYCKNNPTNTFKERVFRQLIVAKLCKHLRLPLVDETEDYLNSIATLETNYEKIVDFYKELGINLLGATTGEQALENFDQFVNALTAKDSLNLEIEVISHECNGPPNFKIVKNNITLYDQVLVEGHHIIKLLLSQHDFNNLNFCLTNKNANTDTQVINGEIVKDKFIEIKSLKIDNYDLYNDPDFFYGQFSYFDDQGCTTDVKGGFWQNSTLSLTYPKLFQLWYQKLSNKNVALGSGLIYRGISSSMLESVKQKLLLLASFK